MTTESMLDSIHRAELEHSTVADIIDAISEIRIAQLGAREDLAARIERIEFAELQAERF